MQAMAVVVPGVAVKDPFEVPLIDDEKMVEALGSDGANRAFRVGIGVRNGVLRCGCRICHPGASPGISSVSAW